VKPVLLAFGDNAMFVGKEIGQASATDVAGLSFAMGRLIALLIPVSGCFSRYARQKGNCSTNRRDDFVRPEFCAGFEPEHLFFPYFGAL
jgi:hypothetical protein